MSTHERLYLRPGVSHAINTMSGAVAECGAHPLPCQPHVDWHGWEGESLKTQRINEENRQCKTCVRIVGDDW